MHYENEFLIFYVKAEPKKSERKPCTYIFKVLGGRPNSLRWVVEKVREKKRMRNREKVLF